MRTSGIHTHLGPVLAVAPVLALYPEPSTPSTKESALHPLIYSVQLVCARRAPFDVPPGNEWKTKKNLPCVTQQQASRLTRWRRRHPQSWWAKVPHPRRQLHAVLNQSNARSVSELSGHAEVTT
jgi:hypothetical protein